MGTRQDQNVERRRFLRSTILIAGIAFVLGIAVANCNFILAVGPLTVLEYHLRHPVMMGSGHPAMDYIDELEVAEWMQRSGMNDVLVDYLAHRLDDPDDHTRIGASLILQEQCGEDAVRALPQINRLIASDATTERVRVDLSGLRTILLERYCGRVRPMEK